MYKSQQCPIKFSFYTNEEKRTYSIIFKSGDNLNQDRFVIGFLGICDRILRRELGKDMKFTLYSVLPTFPMPRMEGLIECVDGQSIQNHIGSSTENSLVPLFIEKLYENFQIEEKKEAASSSSQTQSFENERFPDEDSLMSDSFYGLDIKKSTLYDLERHNQGIVLIPFMDNYLKSCASYCVLTYILGVGDRHLDNLLLTADGTYLCQI